MLDVQGSAEAIVQAMEQPETTKSVAFFTPALARLAETDVGGEVGAPVIGFNVRANTPARTANCSGNPLLLGHL